MFSRDSRVTSKTQCMNGKRVAHVIPRLGVRERTERRFVFMHVRDRYGRVNLSSCAQELARGM